MVLDRPLPEVSMSFYVFCLLLIAGERRGVRLAKVLPNLRPP